MKHTPYDGSSKPFTIGLTQLDPDRWIEPDEQLQHYLEEKKRLLSEVRATVFAAADGSGEAQGELLSVLVDYLQSRYPDIYHLDGDTMTIGERRVGLGSDAPLVVAGSLVQDDLVIMQRTDDGWRLGAGYVAFPSSWALTEKYGRTMDEIHAPVPGFEHGTRNAELIARMFDNLPPGRFVERFNWAVNVDGRLHLPKSKCEGVAAEAIALTEDSTFIRIERQTLRKLPRTGAIVFTIRIYSDPLTMLRRRPDAAELSHAFVDQLRALTLPQAAYKGLVSKRDSLATALLSIAG
ncbi:heme-dependent oxidative N-demethylase family protein [Ensifer sp. MJa1]|uniref:heme-dependent oxidative N-demethylase family protein n=1 Tax=Ensifer sp. MJa1 TaxID=2919888 RepID=UPI003008ED37